MKWLDKVLDRSLVDEKDLYICRILFYSYLFLYFIYKDFLPYSNVPKELFLSDYLKGFLTLPAPTDFILINILQYTWKISLLTSALGIFTRLSTLISFLLGFYLLGLDWSLGLTHHRYALLVVIMGIMALSNCGDYFSVDKYLKKYKAAEMILPKYERWPVYFCQICFVLMYFSAGLSKIYHLGLDYLSEDTMKGFIVFTKSVYGYYDQSESWRSLAISILSNNPILYSVLAFVTLFVELTSPLALFFEKLRIPILTALLGMHVGIFFLMYINFFEPTMVFVFMIPWKRVYISAVTPNK